MPKCLGIYIEDDVIKYSKVDKTKDVVKIESCQVEFYERSKIVQTLEKIIRETFSAKDPISINISNELYNYFEVFSALKAKDKNKLVDVDFEYFCGERGYNKDSLETRTLYRNSRDDIDKEKVIHISTNKENLYRRLQDFGGIKITNIMPVSTSIFNLLDLGTKEDNILIVNIEKDTKVTTVLGGEVYHVDLIPQGMGEILETINSVENDMVKSYECCRNTTIYTQDMQELQVSENEHMDDIMPTLYKIVTEVGRIAEASVTQISKIYITGMGTAINNIDLYFQEHIPNSKCELLKPFFIDTNTYSKLPIKEYIEVNSATALALDGLGYGEKSLNFKGNAGGKGQLDSKSIAGFFKGLINPRQEMTAIDKTALRLAICLLIGTIGYGVVSHSIVKQMNFKSAQIDAQTKAVDSQIQEINKDTSDINKGKSAYDKMYATLEAIKNPIEEDNDSDSDYNSLVKEEIHVPKNAIPNLLNRIVYIIPRQVRVTSIRNTQNKHIVIEAQASKYEQLGYFRAALSTTGYLENVKSTSGTKSGGTVVITIEGDLP